MERKEKIERMRALHRRIESELEEIFGEHIFALCLGTNNKSEPLILSNTDEIGSSIFLGMCLNHQIEEFTQEQKTKIHEVIDGIFYESFKKNENKL